jgi:hypothetical protein
MFGSFLTGGTLWLGENAKVRIEAMVTCCKQLQAHNKGQFQD